MVSCLSKPETKIVVQEKDPSGWGVGYLLSDSSKSGAFPLNYTDL